MNRRTFFGGIAALLASRWVPAAKTEGVVGYIDNIRVRRNTDRGILHHASDGKGFGARDFTYECWYRFESDGSVRVIDERLTYHESCR